MIIIILKFSFSRFCSIVTKLNEKMAKVFRLLFFVCKRTILSNKQQNSNKNNFVLKILLIANGEKIENDTIRVVNEKRKKKKERRKTDKKRKKKIRDVRF